MPFLKIEPLLIREKATESISRDRLSFLIFLFAAFAFLAQVFMSIFYWQKLPPQIPIFYSRTWGQEILSAKISILILPLLTFSLFVINFSMGTIFGKKNPFLSRIILIFTFLIILISFYGNLKIISLIT